MENEEFSLDPSVTAEEGATEETAMTEPASTKKEQEKDPNEESGAESAPTDFSALAEQDLAILSAAFPALSGMASAAELPEAERYGELREAGLSPIEAFCASHHKILTARKEDNRAHLSRSVGRTASVGGARIGAAALSEARDLFPTLSDREIETLYRRVTSAK